MKAKDFSEINKKRLEEMKKEKGEKSVKTIEGYCPIVSTSLEMVSVRDNLVEKSAEYTLIKSIKEVLRNENTEEYAKKNSQTFECLFPILNQKESVFIKNKKKHQLNQEYPSALINSIIYKQPKLF